MPTKERAALKAFLRMEKEAVIHQYPTQCPRHHFGLQAQPKPYWPHHSHCTRPWSTAEGSDSRTCSYQRKGNKSTNKKCLSFPDTKHPTLCSSGKIVKEQVIGDDNGVVVLEGNWKYQNLWRHESQNIISSLMVSKPGLDLMVTVLRIQSHSLRVCQSTHIIQSGCLGIYFI